MTSVRRSNRLLRLVGRQTGVAAAFLVLLRNTAFAVLMFHEVRRADELVVAYPASDGRRCSTCVGWCSIRPNSVLLSLPRSQS